MKELGRFAFGVLVGLLYAFVAWKLWGWFCVPLGAPRIGYLWAWGLTVFASVVLLGMWAPPSDVGEKNRGVEIACIKAILSGMFLLEGWLVHLMAGSFA